MDIESVLNYLDDSVKRNNERLLDMKSFLKKNPSKSLQKKSIHGGVYYYLMYRESSRVRQEYIGCKSRIDIKKEQRKVQDYKRRLNEVKRRYRELKERNDKLQRVLKFVKKISYEE